MSSLSIFVEFYVLTPRDIFMHTQAQTHADRQTDPHTHREFFWLPFLFLTITKVGAHSLALVLHQGSCET